MRIAPVALVVLFGATLPRAAGKRRYGDIAEG
jgi:hypothetical protein